MKDKPPIFIHVRFWHFVLLFFCVLSQGALSFCCGEESFQSTALITTSSSRYEVTLEIADTVAERAQGLMGRETLAENAGMLFVWEENTLSSFWMKDTIISLDMLFIDENYRIIFIEENAEPYSEEPITPTSSFRYVLEVNGGLAQQKGIAVGDQVTLTY